MVNSPDTIRLLIVDDTLTRHKGIRKVIKGVPEIEVVGSATTGVEGLLLYKKLRPDVVAMDINMPLMDGLEATRYLISLYPAAKVFFLAIHSKDQMLERTRQAGGIGYLQLPPTEDELLKAIFDAASAVPEVLERQRNGKERPKPPQLTKTQMTNLDLAHRLAGTLAPVRAGINRMQSILDEITRTVPRSQDPPDYYQRTLVDSRSELQEAIAQMEPPSQAGIGRPTWLQDGHRPSRRLTPGSIRCERRAQREAESLKSVLKRIDRTIVSAELLRVSNQEPEVLTVFKVEVEAIRRDLVAFNKRMTSMTTSLARRNLPHRDH